MEESLKELQTDAEEYQRQFDELEKDIEDFKNSAQSEQEQNIEGVANYSQTLNHSRVLNC